MRGDDSHGKLLQPGQGMDQMHMDSMPGMQMSHDMKPDSTSELVGPSTKLAAGVQAADPNNSLANTQMDAGMTGMMKEQQTREPRMSELQQRNMNAFDMSHDSMMAQQSETSPNANDVPNFPQDAYMEGPMMTMERFVNLPENLGLRPNWSRFMQGMMTFVRVLPPEQYDRVVSAMQQANRPNDPYASLYSKNRG